MVSYVDRLIGSAQRRVTIKDPQLRSLSDCREMVFHIQGFDLLLGDQPMIFQYTNMVDLGIAEKGAKKLGIFDRLLRRPASVGSVYEDELNILHVTFWTHPEIEMEFDLKPEGQVELWSEVYIMIRSGGFDLLRPHGE